MISDGRPRIEDVISHYAGYRTSKRMIHCLLHEDRTPSCSVNYDRQLWNCHSCGASGDSYTLIMLKEDCDFKTAVSLAKKYGLEVEGGGEEEHGNRFTGTKRAVSRNRDGTKKTYKPKFARNRD